MTWPLRSDVNYDLRSITVEELLQSGAVRYVDASECCTLDILMDPASHVDPSRHYDVAEIHPILMLALRSPWYSTLVCYFYMLISVYVLCDIWIDDSIGCCDGDASHGITASMIPHLQCNQNRGVLVSLLLFVGWALFLSASPRNAYQTSMGRQSVGAPMSPGPFDLSPALCYSQRPLCTAAIPDCSVEITESESPMGQNLVVAVCPYNRSVLY